MKHQYFGDINDYAKYSILRAMGTHDTLRIGVCWMLTDKLHPRDGRKTGYLSEPNKWRLLDPHVYDFLRETVHVRRERSCKLVENSRLLHNATYFADPIEDDRDSRAQYFDRVLNWTADRNVIFFDPDNGLEVGSIPYGRKDSSKYLFFRELSSVFESAKSVVVFQHFPRENRDRYILRRANEIRVATQARSVQCFRTSTVAYLIAAQNSHLDMLQTCGRSVADKWNGKIHFSPDVR